MFSIKQCKLQAKKQLKGNYGILAGASFIVFFINLIFSTTETVLATTNNFFLQFVTFIARFCITATLSIAFFYLCIKLAKSNSVKFTDFSDGLTLAKPGIFGTLWQELWLFIWGIVFMLPIALCSAFLFASIFISKYGTNIPDLTTLTTDELFKILATGISDHITAAIFIGICLIVFTVVMAIKKIQYSMMLPILAESSLEHKNIPIAKALKLSIELTKGHKMHIFMFYLSFIGWFLLAIIPVAVATVITDYIQNVAIANLISSGILGFVVAFIIPYMATSFINVFGYLKQQAINTNQLTLEDFQ